MFIGDFFEHSGGAERLAPPERQAGKTFELESPAFILILWC